MRRTPILVAIGLVGTCAMLSAQAKPKSTPPLKWQPAPSVFPVGARMAVVKGDPNKAGPFIIELSMPTGYRIPPHYHPTDETITVKKGTFMVGMGDVFDEGKTKPMGVGAKGEMKAGMHHYAWVKEATVVSVSSTGPFAMTYVNPSDDPTKVLAKP